MRQRLPDEYLGGRGRHRQDCGHTCENERHAGVPKGDPPILGEANEELLAGSDYLLRNVEQSSPCNSHRESLLAEIAKMKAK